MNTPERILVAFASGSEDLIETLLDQFETVGPGLPLYVVAEFPPPRGRWIPWFVGRTLEHNRARVQDALRGKQVVYAAILLQPRMPYWPMRLAGLLLAPTRILCFNENLDHFALHPRAATAILRHLLWRTRNFVRWETQPGGWTYTQIWRIFHPWAYKRQIYCNLALAAGALAASKKSTLPPKPDPQPGPPRPEGISVVVPSRSGRDLLATLLPGLMRELQGFENEVIVSDNGSDDGTASWLANEYPSIVVEWNETPLSFAEAVNRGIRRARFSHTCLLNNDMVLEPGFFGPLRNAFDRVPDLFCATAQIFFPEGVRREETGKAIWWTHGPPVDFPVWCDTPIEGEDLSYVLYGSGGCSLYNTAKLLQVGCVGEVFKPAYVEDLDLGYRGWVRGWPTVFVSGAKLVHHHRSTTKRYFTEDQIQTAVEVNHLRFLARSVANPQLFSRLWKQAIGRLNLYAAQEPPVPWVFPTLRAARSVNQWVEPAPPHPGDEELALALATGDACSFPGRTRDRSKPLVIVASSYIPFPLSHGGAVRIYNLMKAAAGEYDQVLIAFCDTAETPAPEILELCHEVILVRREGSHLRPLTERPDVVEEHDSAVFRAVLREMIRKHRPDVIQLEFTQMGLYARDCGAVPTILVEHDVTVDLYTQLLREHEDWETAQQLTRWQRFERQTWRDVSCVVTMSEKDRAVVEGARRVVVLPNGVDLQRFQPSGQEPEPGRLLFIGSFAHLPNLLALDFFLREAWPALEAVGARLHVISGSRAEHYQELHQDRVKLDLERPGIEVEGFVSDVRPAYHRAELVIAPLLASAGTNIKIMEAMAMAKAVVSTPAGVNGLDVNPGRDVLVVQTGAQMAQVIQSLLRDPERRRRIGAEARRTVEARYSWDAVAQVQSALYRSLIREP
ncbi:glycosyltransferase [uncultured Paludibaculum sp.]|uniref:glycosyltransferase n=1 Tax=uncultured Paludibaculum sp. TaxID=1765020 RepID=UPI002AABBAD9|nr:glycosyltransferase [uncultured Paludibaculum sp.]